MAGFNIFEYLFGPADAEPMPGWAEGSSPELISFYDKLIREGGGGGAASQARLNKINAQPLLRMIPGAYPAEHTDLEAIGGHVAPNAASMRDLGDYPRWKSPEIQIYPDEIAKFVQMRQTEHDIEKAFGNPNEPLPAVPTYNEAFAQTAKHELPHSMSVYALGYQGYPHSIGTEEKYADYASGQDVYKGRYEEVPTSDLRQLQTAIFDALLGR